ncbi:histidinol-phosphate transaminase [Leucobacter sp. W1153]|uniref:histidinol-phosphate transaminase n=1 Tax=Leucobacter sp. W1153 TaxID=3439064 RepID=UPI003F2ADA9A
MVVQRDGIEKLPAYIQGKAIPNAVKLSSNENPYPPLDSVREAVASELAGFHLYPDMGASTLVHRIAERLQVRPEEISVGAGSTEALMQLIQSSAGEGDEVIFPWRSFEAYPILTQVVGAAPVPVPLQADERHDFAAMAAAVTERTRLILVCSPNNPTGMSVTAAELEEFLAAVPSHVLVVFDEAYAHFNTAPGAADGLDFFRRHENVAVLHTFSKAYGLAGLRVGYAVAREAVTANLRRVSLPFGVTNLAQVAAVASLDAEDELQKRVDMIVAERGRVLTALRDAGWHASDSFANFLWLRTGERTPEIDAALQKHGVVVRAFGAEGVRITVGAPEMNDRFLAAIAAVDPVRP